MSDLFLVDTSAWIFALRRMPNRLVQSRLDALLENDQVATCGLVELELLGGAASTQEFLRLRSRLRGVHHLPIEDDDWTEGARLAFDLRRSGVTAPHTDVLISALALRSDATLLHADRDFDLIAGHCPLKVESLADAISQHPG